MFVKKRNKTYCYKSYRRNGKAFKQYIGDEKSQASQRFVQELRRKKFEREERNARNKEADQLIQTMGNVSRVIDILFRYYLIDHGYFKRKSEFRRLNYDN